eukprot:5416574-Pyramimonas_sp.AAC.1
MGEAWIGAARRLEVTHVVVRLDASAPRGPPPPTRAAAAGPAEGLRSRSRGTASGGTPAAAAE